MALLNSLTAGLLDPPPHLVIMVAITEWLSAVDRIWRKHYLKRSRSSTYKQITLRTVKGRVY